MAAAAAPGAICDGRRARVEAGCRPAYRPPATVMCCRCEKPKPNHPPLASAIGNCGPRCRTGTLSGLLNTIVLV
jgi:hypothetical protein